MKHAVGLGASAIIVTACLATGQRADTTSFDGGRAFEHVRQLVAIGPRVAGSAGAAKAREYIRTQLNAQGLTVDEQPFEAATPLGSLQMVNLRVVMPGDAAAGGRVIVAGHYDTKRFTEFRFVGANDGGSSAAFLIELARVLRGRKGGRTIEILFLDGEEAVVEWQGDDRTYGSRYYVEAARKAGTLKDIGAVVLVDMIGDRDLRIKREAFSTAWLTDIIWRAAQRAGRHEFVDEETAIEDDHLPFLDAGVPAVDVIDLEYPAWHTEADTLDKISAQSLRAVADVLLAALPDIEARLGSGP